MKNPEQSATPNTTRNISPETKPRKKKKRKFRQSFARFLQRILPAKSGVAELSGPLNSVAILAQEKLGDCVLLTPLIRNLRRARPDLEIHIIAFSRDSAGFFRNDPDVTAVHMAKKKPVRHLQAMRAARFDLVFNTKDHPSTHFLLQSTIIPARFKVGHANPFHEGLYDRLIDLPHHTHMALKNCALLTLLDIETDTEACRPSLPAMPVSDEVRQLLPKLKSARPVGINISAGEPNRYWTEQKWQTLLDRFPGERFVVLSGLGDTAEKQRIEANCPNVIATPPTRNLYEASRIVSTLKLLVTPDTSMVHVASGARIQIVGLYREAPQDISRFGPYAVPYELVVSTTGEVSGIAPEAVEAAMQKLLQA